MRAQESARNGLKTGIALPTAAPLKDIAEFGRAMLFSRDIDPVYPILRQFLWDQSIDPSSEEAITLIVLYVAYYNLSSAIVAYRQLQETGTLQEGAGKLPIGTERRGMRGGGLLPYWEAYQKRVRTYLGQTRMLQAGWNQADTPEDRYGLFWLNWTAIRGNGRWSAFKAAELFSTVLDWPMRAPDMKLKDCSGPREGLIWLYQLPESAKYKTIDPYQYAFRDSMQAQGLDLSWEELETILCNFNSMRKGAYYVGHDIDEMQHQIETHPAITMDDARALLAARAAVIPWEYLGERTGHWGGVQRGRMLAYAEQGVILTR